MLFSFLIERCVCLPINYRNPYGVLGDASTTCILRYALRQTHGGFAVGPCSTCVISFLPCGLIVIVPLHPSHQAFLYEDSAQVASVSPTYVLSTGGTRITVKGSGFPRRGDIRCRFGEAADESSNPSSTSYAYALSTEELVCNVPRSEFGPGELGSAQVFLATTGDDFAPTNMYVNYVHAVVLNSFSPDRVDEQGNHSILIRGTNFPDLRSLACRFAGDLYSTTPALWLKSTAVRCLTPLLTPGNASIEVTFNGEDFVAAPQMLIVDAILTATGVSPLSGPISGGTKLTVTGTGFSTIYGDKESEEHSQMFCLFGEFPVIAKIISSTSLSCQAPPGFGIATADTHGLAPLTIVRRGNDNTTVVTPSDLVPFNYLYLRDAVLTNTYPSSGPSAGGTRVALLDIQDEIYLVLAAGLEPDIRCRFGPATDAIVVVSGDYSVEDDIFCIAPPLSGTAPTTVSIEVSLNGGNNFLASDAMFSYYETPKIDSASPSAASVRGGSVVVLQGESFPETGGFNCTFGSDATPGVGKWVSSTLLECVSPPHPPGFASVSTTFNGVDTSTSTALLEYFDDLCITSTSPAYEVIASGAEVTLHGTGFVNSSLLCLRWRRKSDGGTDTSPWYVSSLDFVNNTAATFVAPRVGVNEDGGPILLSLEVSNNGLDFVPVEEALSFAISGSPRVHHAFPRHGTTAGSTAVHMVGTGFVPLATFCRFGVRELNGTINVRTEELADANVRNSTHLTCVTPKALPGDYFIEVVTGVTMHAFATATSDEDYEQPNIRATVGFTYIPVPEILTVEPIILAESGGADVTITGVNLSRTGLEACRFGGETQAKAVWLSTNAVRCQAPPSPPGLFSLELTLNGIEWLTLPVDIRYEPSRFAYSLTPSTGPMSGGSLVAVTGLGFAGPEEEAFFCSFGDVEVSCHVLQNIADYDMH